MKTFVRRGYTLIEMLIVISIVALLAALSLSAINGFIERARRLEALNTANTLEVAIRSYRTEYNRYPVAGSMEEDADMLTDDSNNLTYLLIGMTDNQMNRKGIRYFNAKMARQKRGGLVMNDSTATLYDPWGNPYHVIIDVNLDNLIENPDVSNVDPGISAEAPSTLPADIAIFSCGKDGMPFTRDDVVTWR